MNLTSPITRPLTGSLTQSIASLQGASSPYDPAANALFAAMTTPPDAARKTLINNMIVSLKASGVWALLDCLYVLAAADNQAARLNWKAPGTFTASPVNSPAFVVDRGYTGDGSSSLLDSGFNPATTGQGTLNSAHFGYWDRLDVTDAASVVGGNLNTTLTNKQGGSTSRITSRINAGVTVNTTGLPTTVMSHYVQNRNNSATHDVWGAGSKIVAASASTSTSISSLSLTMLARQISAGSYQFSTRQMSAYHWGAALSDAQITSTYSALAAFMTAIGA